MMSANNNTQTLVPGKNMGKMAPIEKPHRRIGSHERHAGGAMVTM